MPPANVPPTSPRRPLRATNLVALLCAPALAPAVAPWFAHLHWAVDLLACFAAQAFAALLLGAVVLAACRGWRSAGVLAAGALSAGIACAGTLPAAATHGATDGGERAALRVFAANLLFGNEANVATLVEQLRRHDADVLLLSELTPGWLRALDAELHGYPFRCLRPQDSPFGIGLLSRLPLTDVQVVTMGEVWAPAIRAVAQTSAGPVGLLGIHPPRPGGGNRNRERDAALAALPPLLTTLPARRVVFGDCNATPFNPSFAAMLDATGLRNAAGGRWLPTWPQQLPYPLRIPIDHVLVDDSARVLEIGTGAAFGSDHCAVFATLAW